MSELATTFQTLQAFPAAFRQMITALPAPLLDWQPASWVDIPSELLSVRQQACHLRDVEIDGYLVRFQRLLHETDPVLDSLDTYALVTARHYDRTAIGTALDAFDAARLRVLDLLAGLDEAALNCHGTFEGYGPVTVRGLIHFLCSHDQQHLAGVQWLAGRYASARF